MANYSKVVSWSGKDGLADSSTAKIISGADFHTEFTAIENAVNTKADLAGSASQAFAATTASAGTNTTQVATTAFVTTASTVAATSNGYGTRTITTGNATGGSNGDIHYKVAS
jgi:hypothetical protein|tara:strand:+ start:2485 stop:2823 length:339 start_codon:yes stop_codon:yes gene_type:complete